jgi:hypothetical protein
MEHETQVKAGSMGLPIMLIEDGMSSGVGNLCLNINSLMVISHAGVIL